MPQIVDTNSLGLTQLADYLDVDYFGLLPDENRLGRYNVFVGYQNSVPRFFAKDVGLDVGQIKSFSQVVSESDAHGIENVLLPEKFFQSFCIWNFVNMKPIDWNLFSAWSNVGKTLDKLGEIQYDNTQLDFGIRWWQLDEDILFERIRRSGLGLTRVEVDALVGGYGYMSWGDWQYGPVVVGHGDTHENNWFHVQDRLSLIDFDHCGMVPKNFDAAFLFIHSPPWEGKLEWFSSRKCSFDVFSGIVGRLVLLYSDEDVRIKMWAERFVFEAIEFWRYNYLHGFFDEN